MFGWFGSKKTPESTVTPLVRKDSWYQRLKNSLSQTKGALLGPFVRLLGYKDTLTSEHLLELKKNLIRADIGPQLTKELIHLVQNTPANDMINKLKDHLLSLSLQPNPEALKNIKVIMMVGVNGAGKTTTTAKLANLYRDLNPLLIAADTYRAAAIEQLQHWAKKYNLNFFSSETTDPAAVVFQGMAHALSVGNNISFIDTSGRLHNNKNLIQELVKIKRVLLKQISSADLRVLLVLDGSQGQNMIEQAKTFQQELGLDGLVITKIDGSSKAGAIFEIMRSYKLPVYFIGCGESVDDIDHFDSKEFIDALFGDE
ncbi:signal recognition particle-docking protein FtsY [bacterium]|jgi:fused signal recognition particle receptor|nr:signal recognition particle-docking protein FtsY [bacterium]NBW56353.1 signal recognition particle-docking protein FtsY [bacterium]NBX72214.1 signal recognition particle-docking protein FtsY [bacterium]